MTPVAIGKTSGGGLGATGFLRPSNTYRVYANVTDVGTPPSGVSTVTANVNNVTVGQTAVALAAGTWTVGGQTYNRRSNILTAGALGNGPQAFTVTATDVAANVTIANGNVTIDNVVPAPSNISASGGIAGRPELNDVFTLTTNDTLDTFAILANWTGAATPVQLRFVNNATAYRCTPGTATTWSPSASSRRATTSRAGRHRLQRSMRSCGQTTTATPSSHLRVAAMVRRYGKHQPMRPRPATDSLAAMAAAHALRRAAGPRTSR